MNVIIVIIILALGSYVFGLRAVLNGEYKPSIYSRLIWGLISVNSFIGVWALHNNTGTIALAGVQLLGSMVMFFAALKYSVKTFSKTEIICSVLLLISIIVWLTAKSPIINLSISLIAHFIGGVPTIKTGWKKPESEDFLFWLLFAIASILALLGADKSDVKNYVYALYFTLFDSTMTILTARQFIKANNKHII